MPKGVIQHVRELRISCSSRSLSSCVLGDNFAITSYITSWSFDWIHHSILLPSRTGKSGKWLFSRAGHYKPFCGNLPANTFLFCNSISAITKHKLGSTPPQNFKQFLLLFTLRIICNVIPLLHRTYLEWIEFIVLMLCTSRHSKWIRERTEKKTINNRQ